MNTGMFSGRIGRDAELRNAKNGDPVSNFPLAVDVGTKQSPKTLWIDCVVWGKRAEALNQYLLKGTKVSVIGRIDLDEFTKRDGTHGAKIQVSCNEIDLHGGPARDAGGSYDRPAPAPARTAAPATTRTIDEDDIPF